MSSTTERRPTEAETTGLIPRVRYAPPRPDGGGTALWGHPVPAPVPITGAGPRYAPAWSAPAAYGPAGPAHPVPPVRPGMRWGWLGLGLVAAVLAIVLIGSFAAGQRTMTVHGTATVSGMSGYVTTGSSCYNTSAMSRSVFLYDASGQLVGTTTLPSTGVARSIGSTYPYYGYADSCQYSFTLPDVAADGSFYRVKVGSGPGDGVGYSAEELQAGGADVIVGG